MSDPIPSEDRDSPMTWAGKLRKGGRIPDEAGPDDSPAYQPNDDSQPKSAAAGRTPSAPTALLPL